MDCRPLIDQFIRRYGESPETIRVVYAPGRVNLIGEHTDYNGGRVLPAALRLGTWIVCRPRPDRRILLQADDLPDQVDVSLDELDQYKSLPWGNYQLGALWALQTEGYEPTGGEYLYHDTLPHGAGLSSSAAIEVGTVWAAAIMAGHLLTREKAGRLGHLAENRFIGVQCGIMDQFASALGKKGHALHLDCATQDHRYVPLHLQDIRLVMVNTNRKRSLATAPYNERRSQCEEALATINRWGHNYAHLCTIPETDWGQLEPLLRENDQTTGQVLWKRTKHVVEENQRVLSMADALEHSDWNRIGQLMRQSHESLRDLYEVTGPELDALAEAAWQTEGVVGARMTGAGFGGCTVNLVNENQLEHFMEAVGRQYRQATGICPTFYVSDSADGVGEVSQPCLSW